LQKLTPGARKALPRGLGGFSIRAELGRVRAAFPVEMRREHGQPGGHVRVGQQRLLELGVERQGEGEEIAKRPRFGSLSST